MHSGNMGYAVGMGMLPAHAAGLRRDHGMLLPTGRRPRLTRLPGVVEMFLHSDAGVAQLARACACQAQGRRFDPGHPLSSSPPPTAESSPRSGASVSIPEFSWVEHPRRSVGAAPCGCPKREREGGMRILRVTVRPFDSSIFRQAQGAQVQGLSSRCWTLCLVPEPVEGSNHVERSRGSCLAGSEGRRC